MKMQFVIHKKKKYHILEYIYENIMGIYILEYKKGKRHILF